MKIQVLLEHPKAQLPKRGHEDDQCWDVCAAEDVTLKPGETKLVDLGFRVKLPVGWGLRIHERSGLACKGVIVGAGIIDEGYRGPMKVVLRYFPPNDNEPWTNMEIKAGDRIAQMRLIKHEDAEMVAVDADSYAADTARGEGGFGSTG